MRIVTVLTVRRPERTRHVFTAWRHDRHRARWVVDFDHFPLTLGTCQVAVSAFCDYVVHQSFDRTIGENKQIRNRIGRQSLEFSQLRDLGKVEGSAPQTASFMVPQPPEFIDCIVCLEVHTDVRVTQKP